MEKEYAESGVRIPLLLSPTRLKSERSERY